MCHYCNYLNPSTELEKYNCEGCGREIKQDHNTAINLVRFDSDPDLAEKARQAGSKA
jgi:transposase